MFNLGAVQTLFDLESEKNRKASLIVTVSTLSTLLRAFYNINAQSFIYDISEISGGLFLKFFLWHDMTKRVMLFHSVPISFLNSSLLKEKMIFSIRFIHPMKKFVFMPFTAVFQEKFHAWYQMKGNDMVYHLRRAEA